MAGPRVSSTANNADVLRHAVTTVRLGLIDHQVIEPEQWDHAVRTLARCHLDDTCPSRRGIHALFRAVRWNCSTDISAAITELDDALRPHLEPIGGQQLTLFDPTTDTGVEEAHGA